jgi:uncharacterized protein (TIGR03118 family)
VYTLRAAVGSVTGILCLLILASCGGGGYGGGSGGMTMPGASVSVSVNPTAITLGQSTVVTWSSNTGTNCTASGGWSGSLAATGTKTVTPTAAGTDTFTLNCTGGSYGGGKGSATLTVTAAIAFSLTKLVADTAGGTAGNTDTNLVNPWGVSIPAGSAPAWVANNHTETSTLYDGNGKPQPHAAPLVVSFAPNGAVTFDPTGIVHNTSTTDFTVTSAGISGVAKFLFDGEGGMLAGWNPTVDATHAITMYTDVGGAVYKGLAVAQNAGQSFLYATDFHNGKVDVFNSTFAKQTTSATAFTFTDPGVPAGYAPFGIQAIANGAAGATQIYVTYAKQQAPDNHDNANGAGLGYVDIYDTNGKLIKQLVAAGGALNAPWGVALAPSDFGTLSGALLVGNFGDGNINAYDAAAGTSIGTVKDSSGKAIATPGLWGIAFGNDANNQPHNTLFFAAGTNNEANGSYGRIDVGSPPVLNAAPVVTLTTPTGSLKGTVTLSATVKDSLSVAKVEFFAGATSLGVVPAAPYTVSWDTTTVPDGTVSVKATATDADGNVGSSAVSMVTVANTAPATVTLTQLQTQIFTPICSVCHTGVGMTLPGVQNLTAGHTFASIVGVPSIEMPTLMRIKPNDPTNSYLIQKIEGAAGISGARMPFGCPAAGNPCLDQATIDMVKAWVSQGALNN